MHHRKQKPLHTYGYARKWSLWNQFTYGVVHPRKLCTPGHCSRGIYSVLFCCLFDIRQSPWQGCQNFICLTSTLNFKPNLLWHHVTAICYITSHCGLQNNWEKRLLQDLCHSIAIACFEISTPNFEVTHDGYRVGLVLWLGTFAGLLQGCQTANLINTYNLREESF